MASLRDIRRRIRSVESTQQITKAMKMVAASKLKKSEAKLRAFRPYADAYAQAMARATLQLQDLRHPLLARASAPLLEGRIGLVAVSADRGLCGGFNANLNQRTLAFLRENAKAEILIVVIGRKGRDFLRKRGQAVSREYVNQLGLLDYTMADRITRDLLQLRKEENLNSIQLLHSHFRSAMSQRIVVEQFLPLVPPEPGEGARCKPFLFEPSGEEALEAVLMKSLVIKLYRALLESVTSEYGARMTAMDNATENAGELIESLTLAMNRARQAMITKEISEIMGGAEALK